MPTKVRIVMNSAGHRALLRSPETLALVEGRAEPIAAQAGDGYEVSSRIGANRARASVSTATPEARRDEAENKTLTSAIGAGRS